MSKAHWKQPYLKQAEKRVADREQAIQEAKFWKEKFEALQEQNIMLNAERNDAKAKVNDLRGRAGGYEFLRSHGVVLMGDEPLHLQGEDMDKYIERHTWNGITSEKGTRLRSSAATFLGYWHPNFYSNKEINHGSNTGIKSQEADQKDTGYYADILRYAYRYGLRE